MIQIKKLVLLFFFFICCFQGGRGQTLDKKDTSEVRFLNSRKFFIYKVEKGETLFSISKKFKIPQEEIIEFNKDVENGGLKNKMKIWVPAYSWLNKNTPNIALVEEDIDAYKAANVYRVAIVSTLSLSKLYLESDSTRDSSYVDEPLEKELKQNLEFTESVMYSFQKLSHHGLKSELNIIDAENDSLKLAMVFKNLEGIHAVITNETGHVLKFLSKYCSLKKIKLVSSGLNSTDQIKSNESAISLLPSAIVQCEQAGYFAAQYFPNSNAIILKTGSTKENERSAAFKKGWLHETTIQKIFSIDYTKNGSVAVIDSMSKNKNTVIFVPTSNEDLITTLLSALREIKDDYKFAIIGLPTWQFFETVDQRMMEQCNVHLFNSGLVNFSDAEVSGFRKFFRDKYNSEPGENAMQGYDAALLIGKYFINNGKKDFSSKNIPEVKGLYSEYKVSQIENSSAFENRIIHVFRIGSDEANDLTKNIKWK